MVTDTCRLRRAESPSRIPLAASWDEIDKEREKMSEQYVLISELAKFCKCDRQALARRIEKRGLHTVKIRRPDTGQSGLAISVADAKVIKESERRDYEVVRPEDLT
jgi:hypothetical protein